MMTRDEIIDAVKARQFSFRFRFWTALDEHCWFESNGQRVKAAWPWALTLISIDQWNDTYARSLESSQSDASDK